MKSTQPVVTAPPAHSRLARPATAWVLLVVILSMFVAFGVIFYSSLTPPALYQAGGGLSGVFVFPFASFAIVGALIAAKRPANRVGWLCLAGAAVLGIGSLSALVGSILFGAHNGLGGYILLFSAFWNAPGGNVAGLFVLMILVFPDGHLVSPSWRWLAYALLVVGVTGLILNVINPTPGVLGITANPHPGITLPVSILAIRGSASVVNTLSNVWNVLSNVIGAAVLVSIFLRLRGADADTRQQIKWVASAAVFLSVGLIAAGFLPNVIFSNTGPVASALIGIVVSVAALGVPAAIGVAVLKYRLYDIDIIISRALVYGTLAILITAVYVGIAVGIGAAVGGGGKPNLGLSILATAIVAVGFQPVSEKVQRVANRLVYGRRATPYEVLSQFSGQVAETYASDEVLPRMARVLAEGTNADVAAIWLRSGEAWRRAAAFPIDPSTQAFLHPNGTAGLSIPGADRAVVVQHHGDVLGALAVTKRRGESITPIETKLMDDLAHQAGLVLRNVGLTADLQARLVDLRASRQRLVAAQDNERRRLERNLHDGAQQYLVAIKVKLGLTLMLVPRDPLKAATTVNELKVDADEALEALRDLARGIYPPLLAEKGLLTALQSQARKATVPITIDADGIGRYPQEIESALYFCVLEAMQNIQKYAQAPSAAVNLREAGNQLVVEVVDHGRGFDVSTTIRGNGLMNMEDRLDALGGTIRIASTPGNGTMILATVPLTAVRPKVPAFGADSG